jgi:hypothetical protein
MNAANDRSSAGPTLFVYRLVPPRPSFGGDMSGAEAAVMAEHGAYWQRLTDEGRVVGSEDDVTALGRRDPAVTSGTCTFEVGTMPVSILPRAAA